MTASSYQRGDTALQLIRVRFCVASLQCRLPRWAYASRPAFLVYAHPSLDSSTIHESRIKNQEWSPCGVAIGCAFRLWRALSFGGFSHFDLHLCFGSRRFSNGFAVVSRLCPTRHVSTRCPPTPPLFLARFLKYRNHSDPNHFLSPFLLSTILFTFFIGPWIFHLDLLPSDHISTHPSFSRMPPKKTAAAGAKKGKTSAYNKYMKEQLAKLKTEKPQLAHKERFKLAATSWAASKENPKNKA